MASIPWSVAEDSLDVNFSVPQLLRLRCTRDCFADDWDQVLPLLKTDTNKARVQISYAAGQFLRKLDAGETLPAVTHQESRDWLLAMSHVATVGDETFFCVGGFKVTYCDIP